ncbi:hypothetical protein pb186bvf_002449 [Paramecium bursaria]
MDYSNTDPAWIDIHHPLISIEFDPNEQQPFKVQIVHRDDQNRLQYFQRPLGNKDDLFFEAASSKMKHIVRNQIKTYSLHVQNWKYNQELRQNGNIQQNFFEATQQLFMGQQFLSARQANYEIQDQLKEPQNEDHENVHSKWQQQLICSIYSGQNLKQLNEFVDVIEQDATVVFFVNGLESLNQDILTKLEQEQGFSDQIQYNQNNVHSALVASYQQEPNQAQKQINIFFIIRYNQGSISQIYSWIFQGICKYFDPIYAWIIDTSIIPSLKSLESQQNNVKENHICGVYGRIQYECKDSIFNITNSLISKYINLRHQNTLIDINVNPLECFYRWNDSKYVIDQLCQVVQDSEQQMKLGNICQSQNSILFQLLQSQNKQIIKVDDYYGKQVIKPELIMRKLSQIINSQYQNYKLSTVRYQNEFQSLIYQILLLTRLVNHYFFISALLYILFVCPYIIINDNIIQYDTLLKLILPVITILAFVVIFILQTLIQPHQKMYVRFSNQDIFVDGKIYIQCVRQEQRVIIKWLMKQEEMKINGKQIDQKATLQFQSKYNEIIQEITLILRIDRKKYKCQLKRQDQIYQIIQNYIDRNIQEDAIYAINHQKILFLFLFEEQNSQKIYNLLYIVGVIINNVIIAMLVYVIYNKFLFDSKYSLIIIISLISILGEIVMSFINQRGNFIQYLKGQIGQLFVYIPLEVCVRFYSMSQSDKSFENKKVSNYHYPKIFALARYFTFNIICLFLMINFEVWFNSTGYVLLSLICYQGLQSCFNIVLYYLEKIYAIFQIVNREQVNTNQSIKHHTEEDHTVLSRKDFDFEEMNFNEFQLVRLELLETYKKEELKKLEQTCNNLVLQVEKQKQRINPNQAGSQQIQNQQGNSESNRLNVDNMKQQTNPIQAVSQFIQNQQENRKADISVDKLKVENQKQETNAIQEVQNQQENPEEFFQSNVINPNQ